MKPDGYVPDILIRGLSVELRRGQGPKKLWILYVLLYSVMLFFQNRGRFIFIGGGSVVVGYSVLFMSAYQMCHLWLKLPRPCMPVL